MQRVTARRKYPCPRHCPNNFCRAYFSREERERFVFCKGKGNSYLRQLRVNRH